jgi:class 3 adenylate cyclase
MHLPDRLQKFLAALVAVVVTTGAVLAPGDRSGIAGLSLDTLFWLRNFAYAPRRDAAASPVALILIDEATYATKPFKGLSKELWTPYFAQVIGAVDAAGPKAIGFDIILPTSMESFIPNYEHSFRDALHQSGAAHRLVMAKVQGAGPPVLPPIEHIFAAGGPGNIRSANMDEDRDGIVRRAPLVLPRPNGRTETTFTGELARRAGTPWDDAELLLNWDGGYPFQTYSFADMRACAEAGNAAFFTQAFHDRVVLIATGLDIEDRLLTSRRFINPPERLTGPRCTDPPAGQPPPRAFSRASIPGAFVYATALDNLAHGDDLRPLAEGERAEGVAVVALIAALLAMDLPLYLGAAGLMLLILLITAVDTVLLNRAVATPLIESYAAALVCFGLMVGFRFTFSDRDKRRIRRIFGLYLAPSVIERLVETGRMPELGGERREMTFFFSDIAGFTTFAEGTDPARLAPILNSYFDGVCDVILKHGGLVVDFAGDGLHALFGAPADQPDHARRGVAAAREVDAFVEQFRARMREEGVTLGNTRIGLHTGPALVGNLGATKRLKYTALGDAVNTAARLEGLNKYFGTRCCLSEATREASGEQDTRPIGDIVLKGRSEALRVHELLPKGGAHQPGVQRYAEAFRLLHDALPQAGAAFRDLADADPTDGCVRFHVARIEAGERSALVVMADK